MTRGAILKAFRTLEAAGLPRPYTSAQEVADTVDVWQDTLDLTDEQLHAAVRAHLRGERSRWWPTPGELLALVPQEQPSARATPELARTIDGDWPGSRAARLGPLGSIACLDAAQEEARAAWEEGGAKPCGAPPARHSCALTCEPCGRDVLERADRLAERAHLRLVEGL